MSIPTVTLPAETTKRTFKMPYSGLLLSGVTPSAATVSAIDLADDSDATASVVENTTATVVSSDVFYTLKTLGIATGKSYLVTILPTFSNGDSEPDFVYLNVVEVPCD